MSVDNPDPESSHSHRKPIILIGAPSGAGKTVLSQKIIAGDFPIFNEFLKNAWDHPPISYDLKILPINPPRDRILIIECSTSKPDKLICSEPWQRMLKLLQECEVIIYVTLKVPKLLITRQYFLRIFREPKQTPIFFRTLQISKYRTTLAYLLTKQLLKSNKFWKEFGEEILDAMSPRVTMITVKRTALGYVVDN